MIIWNKIEIKLKHFAMIMAYLKTYFIDYEAKQTCFTEDASVFVRDK